MRSCEILDKCGTTARTLKLNESTNLNTPNTHPRGCWPGEDGMFGLWQNFRMAKREKSELKKVSGSIPVTFI